MTGPRFLENAGSRALRQPPVPARIFAKILPPPQPEPAA